MHCGPLNQNSGWAMAHTAHPAAPPPWRALNILRDDHHREFYRKRYLTRKIVSVNQHLAEHQCCKLQNRVQNEKNIKSR